MTKRIYGFTVIACGASLLAACGGAQQAAQLGPGALPAVQAPANPRSIAPHAAPATGYRVVDLTPAGALESSAAAIQGQFVGGDITVGYYRVQCGPRRYCTAHQTHGVYWNTSSGGDTDLNPSGYFTSTVTGLNGTLQVGYGFASQPAYAGQEHALMWSGSATSMVDLHPSGYRDSAAYGTDGKAEVGSAVYVSAPPAGPHAMMWFGSAASAVDLHPRSQTSSEIYGISNGREVGYGILNGVGQHAYMWQGSAASARDMNPPNYVASVMKAIDGNLEVGAAAEPKYQMWHAYLWNGTSANGVDLNPSFCYTSRAQAVRGTTEVGWANCTGWAAAHAILWSGSASSYVDLAQFLPSNLTTQSFAFGIDQSGNIVGTAYDNVTFLQHAIMWIPTGSRRHVPVR